MGAPFAISLFGREVLRIGRASQGAVKIPAGSPMSGILSGMNVNRWGFPAETNKTDRLAAYTGYVHSCFSARAQRDAVARYWLIDKRTGERVEEDKAPIPYGYFRKPNPVMSETYLKTLIYIWLGLCGTAPILKIRNAMGVPVMQWPLLPNRVTALYDPVDWVRYEYLDDSGRTVKIPGRDVVFYRNPHPTKLFDGLGDLEAAGLFHDTDVLLWSFQREIFAKGPFSSWILQYPENVRVDPDDANIIAENFEQIVGDREHPAYPVVIGQGVEAKQFPVSNKGLEVPTINEEIKERIRSAAHVSKTILGEVPGESRANVEGAEVGFAKFTEARLRLIDEENERSVLPEWDERLAGEWETVTPEDRDFALRQETARLGTNVITINEVRAGEGLEPVEWGDVPYDPYSVFTVPSDDGDDVEPMADASAPPAADVQKTALNGAQMEAAKATLIDVGSGVLSKPSAIALLQLSFPDVDGAALAAMVNAVEVKEPQPVPAALKAAPASATSEQDEDDVEEDEDERQTRAASTDASRAEKWRAFVALQDPYERKVRAAVRAEFKRQESAVLAKLEEKVPRFLVTLTGWSRKHAEQHFAGRSIADDIADLDDFADDFIRALKPYLLALYRDAGKKALADIGKDGLSFVVNQKGIDLIGNHLSKSTDVILQTTADQIKAALKDGFLKGEGVDDLASRIRDLYDGIDKGRALTIARTETVAPANLGAVEGYKQAGVTRKEWITTRDGFERDSHAAADGTIIGIDEDFTVGADRMKFPGGGSLAEENVNCRCSVAGVVAEEEN